MPDVFISYKSERRKAAEHLAEILKLHGLDVWYDYSLVKGQDFDLQLDHQLRNSRVAIVLWCSMSVDSAWVNREARLAADLGILLPTKIENCDLKLAHISADYVDLRHWDGSPRSHTLDELLSATATLTGRPLQADWQGLTEYEKTWRRFGALPLSRFALGSPSENELTTTFKSTVTPARLTTDDSVGTEGFSHFSRVFDFCFDGIFAESAATYRRLISGSPSSRNLVMQSVRFASQAIEQSRGAKLQKDDAFGLAKKPDPVFFEPPSILNRRTEKKSKEPLISFFESDSGRKLGFIRYPSSGDYYIGETKNGIANGLGVWTIYPLTKWDTPDKFSILSGSVVDGFGRIAVFEFTNGGNFCGAWKENTPHLGVFLPGNPESPYSAFIGNIGVFHERRIRNIWAPSGPGVVILADGSVKFCRMEQQTIQEIIEDL